MKKRLSILCIAVFSSALSFGQCYPDRHSTTWFDSWISCEATSNPNPSRDNSHWISYNLGEVKALNELKMWNINAPDILDYGAKKIAIDYSLNGKEWIEYGVITLGRGSGISTYEGEISVDFKKLEAQHILFTIVENYGGDCFGFSEMKLGIEEAEDKNKDLCFITEIYPNPFQGDFSVYLTKKCLGDVYLAVEDAMGRTVIAEDVIKLYEKKQIGGQQLEPGVYYVCLRSGDVKERYKIVKQ